MKLPEVAFFEDFYFWFNTETKIEYYATPLYFYKASFDLDNIKQESLYEVKPKINSLIFHLLYFDLIFYINDLFLHLL